MKNISNQLKEFLLHNGASLVGFADLSSVKDSNMPYGVSIAIAIPKEILRSIHDGPSMEYYNEYHKLNDKLDSLVMLGEQFLKDNGYRAYAQTVGRSTQSDTYRTALPHKTVATNAGLGWIGKSALLVTEDYGSAIRLSSLLTDAILECATPVKISKCDGCMICANACPAQAISGKSWDISTDRDEFYNAIACRNTARAMTKERLNLSVTLCGKCIEICPYTQRYFST